MDPFSSESNAEKIFKTRAYCFAERVPGSGELVLLLVSLADSTSESDPQMISSYSFQSSAKSSLFPALDSLLISSSCARPSFIFPSCFTRCSCLFLTRRSASCSNPQVSIDAGIANCATAKIAVTVQMNFVYQGIAPAG